MKLVNARVTNYRSIHDSGKFEIDDVTCLVGKNEAGKSAVLMALAGMNPHPATPIKYDRERDYPRVHLPDYDERHPDGSATVVESVWEFEPAEIGLLKQLLGEKGLRSNFVTISSRYDKDIEIEALDIDYNEALHCQYAAAGLDESERLLFTDANNSDQAIKILEGISEPTTSLAKLKLHFSEKGSFRSNTAGKVRAWLPKILYFSSYDRMEGAIQIEAITRLVQNGEIDNQQHSGDKLFVEFMDFSGISIDQITAVETYETFNARLQAASNKITDQILEYWTQNPYLEVRVSIDKALSGDTAPFNSGSIARAKIYNTLHRADTPFSERSAGFVWFFSFFVKFSQVKSESNPVLILLDEPGLTLHGKAQADLLRFFTEKLASNHHQVIYSTHSPFMVPANRLSTVRIVEDLVDTSSARPKPIGTKVRDDVLSKDPDTLFPLQGALGYEITQSLFIGKNTLLVEGPSEILYMQALSDALTRLGRHGLDVNWSICPTGGIDKIEPFVSLFAGNRDLNIAALSDKAKGDGKKIDKLRRSQVLQSGHFYTVADFIEREEADIEDLLEPDLFISLLNSTFELKGSNKLTKKKMKDAAPGTDRLVKQAEAAFRLMPPEVQEFNHFKPAAWLIRNPDFLEKGNSAINITLDTAEKIFLTYNKLIQKS